MARERGRIEQPNVLVVEGPEEARFWEAFFEAGLRRSDIEIHSTGGKTRLRNAMEALVRTPGFQQVTWLGIAQDADTNPTGTYQSIRDALERNALPAPARAWRSAADERRTATIFVWPGLGRDGDLETMIWEHLSPLGVTACIDSYFECLARAGAGPRSAWQAKSRVLAFVASLDRPITGLPDAVRAGLVPLVGGQFQRVVDLLPPG